MSNKSQTYRELLQSLLALDEKQLSMTVTVEMGPEDEYYPAELRITDSGHEVLDENHPVIFVP